MSKQILTPEEREQVHDELWAFLRGKTIEGLSYWTDAGNKYTTGIDLDFSDSSRLELYALPQDWRKDGESVLSWVPMTAEQVQEEEERERREQERAAQELPMSDEDLRVWLGGIPVISRLVLVIERPENGEYMVTCPGLPSFVVKGSTIREVINSAGKAMSEWGEDSISHITGDKD